VRGSPLPSYIMVACFIAFACAQMSTQQPTNDTLLVGSNDTKERVRDDCCVISLVDCYFVMLTLARQEND
jgi:hypothetical protein